ncbi:MAG: hypothetical protein IPL39_20065 [Opitutaceae bacterium]|nr:hypothetical protein [Opitutaceae bacterium]
MLLVAGGLGAPAQAAAVDKPAGVSSILRRKSDGTQVNVSYDADGNRVQKTILDGAAQLVSATYYLVDTNNLTGYSQVLEERATAYGAMPAATTVQTYTYGSDLISATTTLATRYSLLSVRRPWQRARADR